MIEKNRSGRVEILDVSKSFDGVAAVDGVRLTIEPGEFMTLLGPSGSGKSTLLMLVAGFETPDQGEIRVNQKTLNRVPPDRRNQGVVFQHYALFPHMSVHDNLAFPLLVRGRKRAEIRERVSELLQRLDLAGLASRLPRQLSGGQQQRVALARAMIFDPPVLLMDEPLSALDRKLREQVQLELRRVHRELGVTVLYVTHDQGEALALSNRIAVMRRGRLAQVGTPEELYERPADAFVADFLGETNLLEATVRSATREGSTVSLGSLTFTVDSATAASEGARLLLALRPEKIWLREASPIRSAAGLDHESIPGRVREVIYLGQSRRYTVRLEDDRYIVVREPGSAERGVFREGEEVAVCWKRSDLRVLPSS